MTSVGLRELKNHLSKYIHRAEKGEDVLVTDRGKPVARISGMSDEASRIEEGLRRMETEGLLRRPTKSRRRKPWPLVKLPGKPASEMVIEDRR